MHSQIDCNEHSAFPGATIVRHWACAGLTAVVALLGAQASADAQSGPSRDPYGLLTSNAYCWRSETLGSGYRWLFDPSESRPHNAAMLETFGSGTVSAGGEIITTYDGKRRLVRVPCRDGGPRLGSGINWTGVFVGLQAVGSSNRVTTNEFRTGTDFRTNSFDDRAGGFGGGLNFGWNWQPWNQTSVIGVVIDVNGLNDSVRHDFAGGSYIGSVVNFTASAQVRGGVLLTPSFLLYGQGGLSVSNQQLKIDFGGPETNESKFVPGLTIGFGGELKLNSFPLTGNPAPGTFVTPSLFVTYEHTWWDTAKLTMPAASPGFDYSWQRESDAVKFGARINWGDGPAR